MSCSLYPEEINTQKNKDRYLRDDNYFGYDDEFTQLVFKRLTPSLLSVVYTTPLKLQSMKTEISDPQRGRFLI